MTLETIRVGKGGNEAYDSSSHEDEHSRGKYGTFLLLSLSTLQRSIGFRPAVCTLFNAYCSGYLSPSTTSRFDLLWGKKNTLSSVYEAVLWEVCCLGPAQQFQVGAIDPAAVSSHDPGPERSTLE